MKAVPSTNTLWLSPSIRPSSEVGLSALALAYGPTGSAKTRYRRLVEGVCCPTSPVGSQLAHACPDSYGGAPSCPPRSPGLGTSRTFVAAPHSLSLLPLSSTSCSPRFSMLMPTGLLARATRQASLGLDGCLASAYTLTVLEAEPSKARCPVPSSPRRTTLSTRLRLCVGRRHQASSIHLPRTREMTILVSPQPDPDDACRSSASSYSS